MSFSSPMEGISSSACELNRMIVEEQRPGQELFVDAALLEQDQAAFLQLGDVVVDEFSADIIPKDLSIERASRLFSAMNKCLTNRYMGVCATASCAGRKDLEARISRLGIKK